MSKRGRRAMALLGVGPLFFMQCAPEGCAPALGPNPGEDWVEYRFAGKTAESHVYITIGNPTGVKTGERRYDALIDLGFTRLQYTGSRATTTVGGRWTISDHYLVGEPGSDRRQFLTQGASYPPKKWWYPWSRPEVPSMSGLEMGHIATACADGTEPGCVTAGNPFRTIVCVARDQACYFGRVPDVPNAASFDDDSDADDTAQTLSGSGSTVEIWTDSGPSVMSAAEQAANDALLAELAAEQRDYATDAWFLGDIDLVVRGDSGIGADAWTDDKRLDHARLAEYGYRFDPVEWFVPL